MGQWRVLALNGCSFSLTPVPPSWNGNDKPWAPLNLGTMALLGLNPRHLWSVQSSTVLETCSLRHLSPRAYLAACVLWLKSEIELKSSWAPWSCWDSSSKPCVDFLPCFSAPKQFFFRWRLPRFYGCLVILSIQMVSVNLCWNKCAEPHLSYCSRNMRCKT